MKILVLSLSVTLLFLFSCGDDEAPGSGQGTPSCVEALYLPGPEQDTQLLSVRRFEVDGEYHYWLNNGFNAFDGTEYFINESCDTVCNNCGFCILPPCMDAYQNADWEIIWEK